MNMNKLPKNLFGGLLISLGLIFSEKAIESGSSTANSILGFIIFIVGWMLFLSTQESSVWKFGIPVVILAILGQVYMGYILTKDPTFRRQSVMYTAMFWLLFMMAWIIYVYKMTKNNDVNKPYVYTGIALVMISMMGYFFYRENDWNKLTGGLIPSITKDNSIFNPFIILFPFGWSLLAIGQK
jgi:hypothetical protein